MKRPTSVDVAKLAGVSQSTVSFVLNNRKDIIISEETRKRVLHAAKKLNYIPNTFAQGLKINRSKLIGLIVPTITNPFYPMLTQYIEEYCASKGYNVLLCNTNRNFDNEDSYINLLLEKSVDGIIYEFTPHHIELVQKVADKIPVVIIGEKDENTTVNTIALNSFRAGELVAQHLLQLCHKKIAYVTTPLTRISLSRERRLQGILSKLKEHKLDKELLIVSETHEYESQDSTYEIEVGFKQTSRLLNSTDITAIVGVNDMVALGAINAITNQGLKVPTNISVCGFDNIYLSRMFQPTLTTVDHFAAHRSKVAVDILIDRMNGSVDDIFRVEYEPQLLIRASSGPVEGV